MILISNLSERFNVHAAQFQAAFLFLRIFGVDN